MFSMVMMGLMLMNYDADAGDVVDGDDVGVVGDDDDDDAGDDGNRISFNLFFITPL